MQIVSQTVEGGLHRYGYAQARERIGGLANALVGLGIKPGDRVATLAWNGYRHFELYYAIAGIGAVCHTINPRVSSPSRSPTSPTTPRTRRCSSTHVPAAGRAQARARTIKTYVLMTDREHMPANGQLGGLLCYEGLLAEMASTFTWPEFDENAACALCYTSGTTGEPKGVLYSNRSMLLHTFFLIATRPDLFAQPHDPAGPSSTQCLEPALRDAAHRLSHHPPRCPARRPDALRPDGERGGGERLGRADGVARAARRVQEARAQAQSLVQILSGGSAVPQAMIDTFTRDYDIEVTHGWGMTEMGPVGTLTLLRPDERAKSPMERAALGAKQGRRMFGVDLKIIDEKGNRAPGWRDLRRAFRARARHRLGLFQQPRGLSQADRRRGLVRHRRRRQDHPTTGC